MRKAATVALIKNNRVLMQLRNRKNDVVMPGRWGLPGGVVERNETLKQAVIREFQEETGYKLKNPIFFTTDSYTVKGERVKGYIFYETYDGKQKISCSEGKKMGFKSMKDLKKVKIIPRHDKFAKKAIEIAKR